MTNKVISAERGDIKVFTLTTGLEIFGKVSEVTDEYYLIDNALGIQVHPQFNENHEQIGAQIGLGVLSAFSQSRSQVGAMDVSVYKSMILAVNDAPEEIVHQYSTLTGTVAIASPGMVKV